MGDSTLKADAKLDTANAEEGFRRLGTAADTLERKLSSIHTMLQAISNAGPSTVQTQTANITSLGKTRRAEKSANAQARADAIRTVSQATNIAALETAEVDAARGRSRLTLRGEGLNLRRQSLDITKEHSDILTKNRESLTQSRTAVDESANQRQAILTFETGQRAVIRKDASAVVKGHKIEFEQAKTHGKVVVEQAKAEGAVAAAEGRAGARISVEDAVGGNIRARAGAAMTVRSHYVESAKELAAFRAAVGGGRAGKPAPVSFMSHIVRDAGTRALQPIPGAARWFRSQWNYAESGYSKAMSAYTSQMISRGAVIGTYNQAVAKHAAHTAAYQAAQMAGPPNMAPPGAPPVAPNLPPAPNSPVAPNGLVARAVSATQNFAGRAKWGGGAAVAGGALLLAAGKSLHARYKQAQQYEGAALDLRRQQMTAKALTGDIGSGDRILHSFYARGAYGGGTSLGYSAQETAAISNEFYGAGGRGLAGAREAMVAKRAIGLSPAVSGQLARAGRFGGGLGVSGLGTENLWQGAAQLGLGGSDAKQYMEEMVQLLSKLVDSGMKVDLRSISDLQRGATNIAGGDSVVGRGLAGGMMNRMQGVLKTAGFRDNLDRVWFEEMMGLQPGANITADIMASGMDKISTLKPGSKAWADIAYNTIRRVSQPATQGAMGQIGATLAMNDLGEGLNLAPWQLKNMANMPKNQAVAMIQKASLDSMAGQIKDDHVDRFEGRESDMTAIANTMLDAFDAWRESLVSWTSTIQAFAGVVQSLGNAANAINSLTSVPGQHMIGAVYQQQVAHGVAAGHGLRIK